MPIFVGRHFVVVMVVLLLTGVPMLGLAQSSDEAALIARAEQWLNGIDTMSARFTQITDNSQSSQGDFYLQRPYRTRFAYDAPDDLVLITTEQWLHVEETNREQVTSYPVGQTLLKHLLNPHIRLTPEGITTSARQEPGVILVTLRKDTGDDAGVLQLAFAEDPFALLGWTIRDAIGMTTQVLFADVQRGVTLSPRLFTPSDYRQDGQR